MKIFNLESCVYYESQDFEYSADFLEPHINSIKREFIKRRLFRHVIECFGKKYDLEGYIMLQAHGSFLENEWVFHDRRSFYGIQDWIDEMDGTSLAILLNVCNPSHYDIHSSKSVVIHPRCNINLRELIRGGSLRIFVPEYGYLETYYKMRRVIDTLNSK